MKKQKLKTIQTVLIVVIALLIVYNQYELSTIGKKSSGIFSNVLSKTETINTEGGLAIKYTSTGNAVQDAINAIISKGTPAYGNEIGASFDDPVNSLNRLAALDTRILTSSLTQEELQRFIDIDSRISCEYCCSAPSVIDSQGRDACGCAHAASFRGLTKFLLKTHPTEYSNDEILLELTKWKSLYYPKNMVEKAAALIQNKMDLTAAALNDRDLLNKLSAGDTSAIGELPEMVGGC